MTKHFYLIGYRKMQKEAGEDEKGVFKNVLIFMSRTMAVGRKNHVLTNRKVTVRNHRDGTSSSALSRVSCMTVHLMQIGFLL